VKPIRYDVSGWGVGELWLAADERVVWSELPRPAADAAGEPAHPLVERVRAFFAGADDDFADVELDLEELPEFHRRCAAALRTVPRGEVVTYGELAALAGAPGAARAAGTFCATTRHAPFLPVHRVVGANGIGGWGSLGTEYKRRLLALERVTL
jgi:methylated-DNA-[protein]-cysteine S-methyltransferase